MSELPIKKAARRAAGKTRRRKRNPVSQINAWMSENYSQIMETAQKELHPIDGQADIRRNEPAKIGVIDEAM